MAAQFTHSQQASLFHDILPNLHDACESLNVLHSLLAYGEEDISPRGLAVLLGQTYIHLRDARDTLAALR